MDVAALIACAVSLFAGGCAGMQLQPVKGVDEFRQEVLMADRPVLMTFYKGGCVTCVMVEPTLDKLAVEYRERGVKFTKMEVMSFFFAVKEKEISEQYDVTMYPTVVLFVDGKETRRWLVRNDEESYRKALDEVAAPPPDAEPAGET